MIVRRPETREGYDLWSEGYDDTPNPVVSLDEMRTPQAVRSKDGERILDAGCGTGRYFPALMGSDCELVGLDFSIGMLRVAKRKYPGVPILQADLRRRWPFADRTFDAVLCALVGEHVEDLYGFSKELHRVLRPGGRMVFSVYHPAMADAGKEANFRDGQVEYRLGAFRHSSDDYAEAFRNSGLRHIASTEFLGDEHLAAIVPEAKKYVGFPMLLVFEGSKP